MPGPYGTLTSHGLYKPRPPTTDQGYTDATTTEGESGWGDLVNTNVDIEETHLASQTHVRLVQPLPRAAVSAVAYTGAFTADGSVFYPYAHPLDAYAELPIDQSGLGRSGIIDIRGSAMQTTPAETFLFTEPWEFRSGSLQLVGGGGRDVAGAEYDGPHTTSPNPLTDGLSLRSVTCLLKDDPSNRAALAGKPLIELAGAKGLIYGVAVANAAGSAIRGGFDGLPCRDMEISHCVLSRNAGYGYVILGDSTDQFHVHHSFVCMNGLGGGLLAESNGTYPNRHTCEFNTFSWNGTWTLTGTTWEVAGHSLKVAQGGRTGSLYSPWAHIFRGNQFFGSNVHLEGIHASTFGPGNYLELPRFGPDADVATFVINNPFIHLQGCRSLAIERNAFHHSHTAESDGWDAGRGFYLDVTNHTTGLDVIGNEFFTNDTDSTSGGFDHFTASNPMIWFDTTVEGSQLLRNRVFNFDQTRQGIDDVLTFTDFIGPTSSVSGLNLKGNKGEVWDDIVKRWRPFGAQAPEMQAFDRAPTDDDYVQTPPPGTRAPDVANGREYVRQSDGTWMWVEVSS